MAQLLTSQVSTMEVTDDDPADVHDYEDIASPHASPVASPAASPVASPAASPVASPAGSSEM